MLDALRYMMGGVKRMTVKTIFKVGDEIEFIRDTEWKGIHDYVKTGDRGRIVNMRNHMIDVLDIRMDLRASPVQFGCRSWTEGDELPLSASNASTYIKLVGYGTVAVKPNECPASLKKWLQSVQAQGRT
jgi:hypothetical protein